MTPAGPLVALAFALLADATPPGSVGPAPLLAPFTIVTEEAEGSVLSQRPMPALTGLQLSRLQTAMALRAAGKLDEGLEAMLALQAEAPHHPLVLTELARLQGARGDWAAVERLGRSERAAQHDSLLLGRPLVQALERLRRPREAAQVALECWIARPGEADWAFGTLARLATADSRGVREVVHRLAGQRPDRVDLQTAAARLDWKMGDASAAMKALLASDRPGLTPPLRWTFAEELLFTAAPRDSAGAVEALVSMASDARFDASYRMQAARRVLEIHRARGTVRPGVTALYQALRDLPPARWNSELLVDVARALRESGQGAAARALLEAPGLPSAAGERLSLERALYELRDGSPARALELLQQAAGRSPEGEFRLAEALFFTGLPDSALAVYRRVSADPRGPFTGAALERMFLIEDADPKGALPVVGRLMYLDWRGDGPAALQLADSLYQALPRGPLWAQVALFLGERRDAAGQPQAALAPLLEVAEKLPDDRLAPLARQRAGDLYLFKLKNEAEALAQYEACLTRYPRAWNSAEVRRRLEALRRRRF